MSRSWWLLGMMSSWLLFLAIEKKDQFDYLPKSLSAISPRQFVDWKSGQLFFSDWSIAEPSHRWSNSRRPIICFKHVPLPSNHQSALITIDAKAVDPLVGKTVKIHLNNQSIDYQMVAGYKHRFLYNGNPSRHANILCMTFELPVTMKVPGDSRDLGLYFTGLQFSFLE